MVGAMVPRRPKRMSGASLLPQGLPLVENIAVSVEKSQVSSKSILRRKQEIARRAADCSRTQVGEHAVKLAIPDMISNSYFPAIAAIELGLFKREGLDVELELIYPVDKSYAALREGAVDFVGGSAHSALSAFPRWQGAKLLCAQGQGMYWFLVMHRDLGGKRGDVEVVKGA